jgi:hypothetical protein
LVPAAPRLCAHKPDPAHENTKALAKHDPLEGRRVITLIVKPLGPPGGARR